MTDTHCPYCALQCAITLTVDPTVTGPGRVSVAPRDFPTNRGRLCQKGWTAATLLDHPDRLTTPLVRRDGELRPATWDEAYAVVIDRLTRIREESGPDAVAVFGGGGLTNEKAYLLGKFARLALGTAMIDYNGRFCMSSAAAAGNRAFGIDRGLPFPLADVGGADAILLIGSNLAATMPPAVQHLDRARRHGGLIVIDPRRSETAGLTEDGAGMHLQPVPGTDLTVLLGLLHVLVAEHRVDETYLAARTTGWEEVRRSVSEWWPERVEASAGVPAVRLREAARLLARAAPGRGDGAYVLTGRGAEQHAHGTDTVTAAINLSLALGLPGRPGSGFGCLTGQGNGQGGREHGQKCDQLPGYRRIDDPTARAHVAGVWGVDADALPGPGIPATALLHGLGTVGGARALLVHGSNPVVSGPDAARITERLAALDLLVVCDLFVSETAELADVVLPVTQWAEETGTMTSLEGRVLHRRAAVAAPEGVRDELRVLSELAARLGCRADFPTDPDRVLEELGRASAGGPADYTGITPDRLAAATPLFWPCPGVSHPGTPRLFRTQFATPDGLARMTSVHPTPVADDLRTDAPIYLITGRVLQQYQSGTQTRRVAELCRVEGSGFVQLHPRLARRLAIAEGDQVEVSSARGTARAPARISRDIRPDTVFMPFHFPGEARANTVTNPTVDPISAMPEFKVCAVRVSRVGPPPSEENHVEHVAALRPQDRDRGQRDGGHPVPRRADPAGVRNATHRSG